MATALRGETAVTTEQIEETHTRNVAALTARVHTIKQAKVDAVADTRALRAIAIGSGDNHPAQVVLGIPSGLTVQVGPVAHDQFAAALKIDRRYYDRMNVEAAPLLAQNLNWWLQQTPSEKLLRMLRPEGLDADEARGLVATGATFRLRGLLGKGYRTIDDADLIDALLPTLIERGARLHEFSIDERRMHAGFYTEYQEVQTIRAKYAAQAGVTIEELDAAHGHVKINGKDIAWVNETIASGVVIRHSEVGFASLGASFVQKVLKCLNRMVEENSIAIRHVGGKNGSADDDVRFVSDTTQLLDNAALISRVQDTVAQQFEPAKVVERATRLLVAKVEEIRRPDVPLFEFVGNVGANLGLSQTETELLKEETSKAVAQEGGEVKFAFVQGITAVARQMTDYDRRLEIERTGFQLLNDDAGALVRLGRDAERNARKRLN